MSDDPEHMWHFTFCLKDEECGRAVENVLAYGKMSRITTLSQMNKRLTHNTLDC